MKKMKQQIQLKIGLEACLQLWLISDFYPKLAFSEVPICPSKWSSCDAWGEHLVGGSRQVRWQMVNTFSDVHKEINWTIQNYLNNQLVQLSGSVVFESIDEHTWLTLTVTDANLATHDLCLLLKDTLSTQLEAFEATVSRQTRHIKSRLKMAV